MAQASVKIDPRAVARVLGAVILALAIFNELTLIAQYDFGRDYVYGLIRIFRLNAEGNIPTFYSATALLATSFLCAVIGRAHQLQETGSPMRWYALALIVFALSCDEAGQIHELLDANRRWTEGLFVADGALLGPWVVAYGTGVAIFAIAFFPFFLSLKRRYQLIFGGAGALFVTGAIGFEMIGAAEWTAAGGATGRFEAINSLEEMMEMTAVAIVIVGLLSYMKETFGWNEIVLSSRSASEITADENVRRLRSQLSVDPGGTQKQRAAKVRKKRPPEEGA